jgi:chromosome partitioning protein
MTRIIAIANQKGGVGKTTTAINLSAALARGAGGKRERVLVVDVDPQSNTTAAFLGPQAALGPVKTASIYEVLAHEAPTSEAIQRVELVANEKAGFAGGTLDLLPSHIRLAKAEIELQSMLRREYRLADALDQVAGNYDFILIDCPPSLALLTINALIAAAELLVPIEPGYFPLIGLGLLMDTVNSIAKINGLKLLGVIPTMQSRTVESRETVDALTRQFGSKILAEIPNRVAIRNAHANQVDIFSYAPDANLDVAAAYAQLAREVQQRD